MNIASGNNTNKKRSIKKIGYDQQLNKVPLQVFHLFNLIIDN